MHAIAIIMFDFNGFFYRLREILRRLRMTIQRSRKFALILA